MDIRKQIVRERLTAAALLGAVVVLLSALVATCADAQPPGIGDDWTANGWTTWTFLPDSLPDAGWGDSLDVKSIQIRNGGASITTGATINIGYYSPGPAIRRALFYIDAASTIPTNHEIMDAVLCFQMLQAGASAVVGPHYIAAYRVLETWYQTTATTYANARAGVAWGTAGCGLDSLDWGMPYSGADSWYSQVVAVGGADTVTAVNPAGDRASNPVRFPFYYDGATLVSACAHITDWVRGWFLNSQDATKGYRNYGILLRLDDETTSAGNFAFYGENATTDANKRSRPVLWVATRPKAGTTGGASMGMGRYGY
jgi:hypothetical protein